jgi:AcrR family transcriptional regulator
MPASDAIAANILRAADQVFRDSGFERAEMRTIAQRAGIAVGTIYNYFPNKWGLFLRILYDKWERVEDRVRALRQDARLTWRERLLGILEAQMAYVAENAPIWTEIEAMATSGQRLPAGGDPASVRQVFDWLTNQVSEVLQESGEPRWSDPSLRERQSVALIAAAGALARLHPKELDQNVAFLRQMLAA